MQLMTINQIQLTIRYNSRRSRRGTKRHGAPVFQSAPQTPKGPLDRPVTRLGCRHSRLQSRGVRISVGRCGSLARAPAARSRGRGQARSPGRSGLATACPPSLQSEREPLHQTCTKLPLSSVREGSDCPARTCTETQPASLQTDLSRLLWPGLISPRSTPAAGVLAERCMSARSAKSLPWRRSAIRQLACRPVEREDHSAAAAGRIR